MMIIVLLLLLGINVWLEFQGTSKKLARYNSCLDNINSILLWWNSLTPIDKMNITHTNQLGLMFYFYDRIFLVSSCEDVFRGEIQGWSANFKAQKMLRKENNNYDGTDNI